jgi:DNA-binding transcriptional regulator YbjK
VALIADSGMKAVTHRAVSARAGLPPPTAGYYFATVNELIEQTLTYHVDRRVTQLTELLDAATSGAAGLEEMGEAVARALISGASPTGLTQYEVYLEAARNPALRSVVAQSMASFEAVAAVRLTALGARNPERAAKAFVAVADGFALHRLAFPEPFDDSLRLLLDGLRGLFLSFVLDETTIRDLIADVEQAAEQPRPA